jgi:hypothetical protein
VEKPLTDFHKNQGYCPPCKKEYDKAHKYKYYKKPYNRLVRYSQHIRLRYALTLEGLNALYLKQNGKCPICLKELSNPTLEDANRWESNIDHDHNCCPEETTCGKCIRGLLCRDCNLLIGHAKDDLDTLKRAVEYLTNSKKKEGN